MLRSLEVCTRGLLRFLVVAVLALLATVCLLGFLVLAYASLMDADIHVEGGVMTLATQFATLVLCVAGIRALVYSRTRAAS